MNAASTPICDGVSFTVCDDSAYAFGGATPEIIWWLHFTTRTWKDIPCTGAVPPPCQYHAMVGFARHLLLSGGEPLLLSRRPKFLPYYELSLESFTWMCIETTGTLPLNRSHHSCIIVDSKMVLVGGKPVSNNKDGDGSVTNEQMNECDRSGFYNVYTLNIAQRIWESIDASDRVPRLWGHSAVGYDKRYVLVFGGLDVSQRNEAAISRYGSAHYPHDPPVAVVSNKLYILDVKTMLWSVVLPSSTYTPLPRALHAAHVDDGKMYLLGGFDVTRNGKLSHLNDLWVYDIVGGSWSAINPPIGSAISLRGFSCIYASQLIIVPSLSSLWYLDVHVQATVKVWKEVPTSHMKIFLEPAIDGPEEYNEIINPRRTTEHYLDIIADENDACQPLPLPKASLPRAILLNEAEAVTTKEIDLIIDEIHQLRDILLSQRNFEPQPLEKGAAAAELDDDLTTRKRILSMSESSAQKNLLSQDVHKFEEGENKALMAKRIFTKNEEKSWRNQRQRIKQLAARLKILEAVRDFKERDKATEVSEMQHALQESLGSGVANTQFIESCLPREDPGGDCNEFLSASVSDRSSSTPTVKVCQTEEGTKKEGKRVYPPPLCSSNGCGVSDRWTKLIDAMKLSPLKPSNRAFRASTLNN